MARKLTRKGLLTATWKEFSRMIRAEAADAEGYVQCVTCEKRCLWNSGDMHAGHFLAYRYPESPVRFLETNVHPQCRWCNTDGFASIAHFGSIQKRETIQTRYIVWMAEKYGIGVISELESLRRHGRKKTEEELQALREHCRERADRAIEKKGLA